MILSLSRIREGQPLQTPESAVKLVYSDGCRDQAYCTLASSQPWREELNPLVNNFDFWGFMFQEMQASSSRPKWLLVWRRRTAGSSVLRRWRGTMSGGGEQ